MVKIKYFCLKAIILLSNILIFLFFGIYNSASAQMQNIPFSGNDPKSYYCQDGTTPEQMEKDEIDGFFYCKDGTRAIIRPPTIQQFEILFKRIVYVIWAIVASLSFVMLVYLGYKYMIARDTSDRELVKLRKAILNYIFGFSLVFLSVPILTTLFKLLNLNTNISCYDIAMPGFQFFFPELCTDPIGIYYVNPKQVLQLLIQKAKSIKEKQNVELLEAYEQAYNEFNSTVCDINKYNQPITEKDIIRGCEILYTLQCGADGTWELNVYYNNPQCNIFM